jgi:hypothetical protein
MTPNEYFLKEAKKELAFVANGAEYYQFTDGGLPIYYKRFYAFQETMRRHEEWKVTQSVFEEYLDMVDKFTNDNSLTPDRRIAEIQRLTTMLKWRREQSNELMLVYELASVWYFDESEDPCEYDSTYAKKKVDLWLNTKEIEFDGEKIDLIAFFLRTPLNRFIDFQNFSQDGMIVYLNKLYQTQFSHSLYNFSMLSESEKGTSIGQNINFLMEMYKGLVSLTDIEQPNITTS